MAFWQHAKGIIHCVLYIFLLSLILRSGRRWCNRLKAIQTWNTNMNMPWMLRVLYVLLLLLTLPGHCRIIHTYVSNNIILKTVSFFYRHCHYHYHYDYHYHYHYHYYYHHHYSYHIIIINIIIIITYYTSLSLSSILSLSLLLLIIYHYHYYYHYHDHYCYYHYYYLLHINVTHVCMLRSSK